ncbi:aldehyde ferredoxin oxidoreductase N-terminal domain-containing protein [Fundidesulfovibrio soli]|uniref:aldehyde ferredoxin oxidoreductase N-terminal domain-containing protein n=1 Tax=Fundidesulfovibrio soli TaxID=2922716 RepID=UPI001FAE938E|nr:aldehyde ferredoxin oxidoreductase N-terminal domain-containing protein [Fundidesulfovibrio soli]
MFQSNPEEFRVLVYDLDAGKGDIQMLPGRSVWCGGSGLAAMLFAKYGDVTAPAFDPRQPLIFAIGPLNGYFPLMSKTVCGFKSPYNENYAESHAGGRSSLALRFAGLDALVLVGRASAPSCLVVGSRQLRLLDVHYLWGADVATTGKLLRKVVPGNSGHRSILRIGPAGENLSSYACINTDTFRHFGRLGSGAVMGAKNLKGIVIHGDGNMPLPENKSYPKLFKSIHEQMTDTEMMEKYHNLGTPVNALPLNEIKSLPWRNMTATSDPDVAKCSGEAFADKVLMRNAACSGCPVGCIHVGMLREQFSDQHRFAIHQVSYDHEPNFAVGTMLGVVDPASILSLIDMSDRQGLDVISAGVTLAWATEAFQKGLVSQEQTLIPLAFGDLEGYRKALWHIGHKSNDFYGALGKGALVAARSYGGEDFACVIGQEMAGYATGETYFVSQTVGFRHSHLDTSGYSYDQKHAEKDVDKTVKFLLDDETERVMLTNLVACLFARGVYKPERVAEALDCLGYKELAQGLMPASEGVRRERWRLKIATGFDPMATKIPKRFSEITTWKGPVDADYMEALRKGYAARIAEFGASKEVTGS